MLLIGKPSILMGHLYHGYVSHNQRVLHLPAIWLFTQLQGFQHHRIKADPPMVDHPLEKLIETTNQK